MMRRLYLATALIMLCLAAAPVRALAFDPFGSTCSTRGAGGSAVCQTPGQPSDPLTGSNGTLAHITNIIAFAAGAAAIIVIIVSALRFITSGSDVSTGSRTDTDIEDARRSIANALIGLVVIVAARTLILFVLNRVH